jgi:hypothetical protein
MPWEEKAINHRGLKGRESFCRSLAKKLSVQVLAAFQAAGLWGPVGPGPRPAASALGWGLPARWAGRSFSFK